MADIWSRKKRSEVMSLIRSKNTAPEKVVRKIIYGLGYRYRLNVRKLPGSPDVVIAKHKCAVFVNGCFWHFHPRCRDGKIPTSRKRYWKPKLLANRSRDVKNRRLLRLRGWKVLTLWECQVKRDLKYITEKVSRFFDMVVSS